MQTDEIETTRSAKFWEIEVEWRDRELDPRRRECIEQISAVLGEVSAVPTALGDVGISDLYFLAGDLEAADVERVCERLLVDPVTQVAQVTSPSGAPPSKSRSADGSVATLVLKPGVMDPVEASLLEGLGDLGMSGLQVRTGTRHRFSGAVPAELRKILADKVLSNPVIEDVLWDDDAAAAAASPFRRAEPYRFARSEAPVLGLEDDALEALSQRLGLSLNLREMQTIQRHFAELGREPVDVELETIAQTWSEHCCHKTLTGRVEHFSPAYPAGRVFENLLKETVFQATQTIDAPWCLSVFKDNAGVIAFDDEFGVSFKVETHNHPSAIEPYGGAGTGIGGVLRDTLGTGLGAKPIVNTDIFCFGPPDLDAKDVPPGALHPRRVMRGVVSGVRDYGNRMGIPTASGAVYFDERYVGNPLVYCGSVGLIARDKIEKDVATGDRIYVLGGRTGRDGIHGATFSSVELSEESEMVSSGAVQIGNPITEKKVLDVLLVARDRGLYRGVTDCGAGGLSSAIGEMGEEVGARVALERVPLKYDGLSYWEIWISEAQERMVFAVPPEHAEAFEILAASEDVECTDVGEFGADGRLILEYAGERVCDLAMSFLFDGRPEWVRRSESFPSVETQPKWTPPADFGAALEALLAMPNIASKEWVIRQYDHEVQGQSVLKSLQGVRGGGPGDGVAFTPRFDSARGIVLGCGMNPCYGDVDAYRMAVSAVDEALRNVVAVGGNPAHTALLDNYCWGNTDRPETLGTLVEASIGLHDAAVAFGAPFVSGKDSLNNEFRVGDRVISIPPSLLVSSISVVEDVRRLVSMDLKAAEHDLVMVGVTRNELGGSHLFRHLAVEGGVAPDVDLVAAPRVHAAMHAAITAGLALSVHDLSEGGLAVAAAEMAFAGDVGARIDLAQLPCDRSIEEMGHSAASTAARLFSESNTRYLVEVAREKTAAFLDHFGESAAAVVGRTDSSGELTVMNADAEVLRAPLATLADRWRNGLSF